MFSQPTNSTSACTTQLNRPAQLQPELEKRAIKIICLGVKEDQNRWKTDIEQQISNYKANYSLIDHVNSEQLGMLDCKAVRAVYIVAPNKLIKAGEF